MNINERSLAKRRLPSLTDNRPARKCQVNLRALVMTDRCSVRDGRAALCKASLIYIHLKAPQCLSLAHGLLPPGQRFILRAISNSSDSTLREWDQVVPRCLLMTFLLLEFSIGRLALFRM